MYIHRYMNPRLLSILVENRDKIEYHFPKKDTCGKLYMHLSVLCQIYKFLVKEKTISKTDVLKQICELYSLSNGDLLISIRTDKTCDIVLMYLQSKSNKSICFADININPKVAVFNYDYHTYGSFPINYHQLP